MKLGFVQTANIIISQHGSCYGAICSECPAFGHHKEIGDAETPHLSNNLVLEKWLQTWVDNFISNSKKKK